jgi:hypothetical protein
MTFALNLFHVSFKWKADFFFANILKGVPIPFVSNPTSMIPIWTQSFKDYAKSIFSFAECYISKRGEILVFYPNDLLSAKGNCIFC